MQMQVQVQVPVQGFGSERKWGLTADIQNQVHTLSCPLMVGMQRAWGKPPNRLPLWESYHFNIRTNESTTEVLEKVYTKLMECVSHYKGVYDRTQLLKDLGDKIDNLLPQMSTTPVASRKKSSSTSQ